MTEAEEDEAFFEALRAQYSSMSMEGVARVLSARLRQMDKRARAANTRADAMLTTNGLIQAVDEKVLVGLVMKLTGGSANPSVVGQQVKNWRQRLNCSVTASDPSMLNVSL